MKIFNKKYISILCLCFLLTFSSTLAANKNHTFLHQLTNNIDISNYDQKKSLIWSGQKAREKALISEDSSSKIDKTYTVTSRDTNAKTSLLGKSKLYPYTKGTAEHSNLSLGNKVRRSSHGVRISCPVSHFAHDDPILFPKQPGKSHLHMFIANTSADAMSTPQSLLNNGNSSCEGGINARSSYWIPALFNDQDEVVIPEMVFIYYKTFGVPNNNYQDIQVIPNGMQMLAMKNTLNYKNRYLGIEPIQKGGKKRLKFTIYFPNCFATENNHWNGKPILSYRDMPEEKAQIVNSHVAYPPSSSNEQNFLGCPNSHPYRAPTMSLHIYYDPQILGKNWYLASDLDNNKKGETLHADYIAAWDRETMERIAQCNREARSCNFVGGKRQLPARFLSADDTPLYKYSNILGNNADRTPFGKTLTPFNLN